MINSKKLLVTVIMVFLILGIMVFGLGISGCGNKASGVQSTLDPVKVEVTSQENTGIPAADNLPETAPNNHDNGHPCTDCHKK